MKRPTNQPRDFDDLVDLLVLIVTAAGWLFVAYALLKGW